MLFITEELPKISIRTNNNIVSKVKVFCKLPILTKSWLQLLIISELRSGPKSYLSSSRFTILQESRSILQNEVSGVTSYTLKVSLTCSIKTDEKNHGMSKVKDRMKNLDFVFVLRSPLVQIGSGCDSLTKITLLKVFVFVSRNIHEPFSLGRPEWKSVTTRPIVWGCLNGPLSLARSR